MLASPGAVRTGHFQLLSGLHTDTFLAFSAIASESDAVEQVAGWLTPTVGPWQPDLVLAPTTAGVALAGVLARRLGVPLALTSLDTGGRATGVLGDVDLADRHVLVVNDVYTTGQGLRLLADTVTTGGGTVAGAAWFLTRADRLPDDLPPHVAVVDAPMPSWTDGDCPLCADGDQPESALDLN